MRLGKKVYDSERARAYGPYMGWHHVDCFVAERETLEFFEEAAKMPGLKTLTKEDQQMLKAKLKKIEGWVTVAGAATRVIRVFCVN